MPSETFYCPHCSRQLTKSAQAYVLGEIMGNKKSNFIGIGEMPRGVTCPNCRRGIDATRMIRGDYDHAPVDMWNVAATLTVIASILVLKLVLHWSWVASGIVGLIGGIVIIQIVAELSRTKKKKQ